MLMLGCSESKEPEPLPAAPVQDSAPPPPARRAQVVIPAEVRGQWKAVQIAVLDRETGQETLHTVDVGAEFHLEGTRIGVRVQTFLPDFIMHGLTMTSSSNQPNNPGVQIRIREGDEELFAGWLFSLYPDAHAYYHPRYGFTLVDFIPATPADENPEK
ncbi:hypothetical protein [Geoalkalibacter sp.]|uniref:hypothetical protein n=1 Tax=Geoalkalibacter sp. TaxID=3041440 RepID=UPI002F3F5560